MSEFYGPFRYNFSHSSHSFMTSPLVQSTKLTDGPLSAVREKLRRDNQRREQRMLEALQSPRWDARLVAEHSIAWLRKNGLLDLPDPRAMPPQPSTTRSNTGISSTRGTTGKSSPSQDILHDAVGCLLHRMVLDGGLASRVTRALDIWKAWTDAGGMRRADLTTLQENKSDDDGEDGSGTANFARASLLLAVVGNMTPTAAATDGALAVDLQECLRLWTKVRLG